MCYHLDMAIIGGLLSFSTTLFDIISAEVSAQICCTHFAQVPL